MDFEEIRELRKVLTEVIWLAPQLELTITRQTKFSGPSQGIGKSTDTPLYFNESASEANWVLRQTLQTWMLEVECGCEAPWIPCVDIRWWTPNRTIADMATWLRYRVTRLQDPDALDELKAAKGMGMAAIDCPPTRIYLGDCACGTKHYGDPEMDEAECSGCACILKPRAMRAANQEKGRKMLVTANEAVAQVGSVYGIQLEASRIRVWSSRGKLHRFPSTKGPLMYELGEIIDLATAMGKLKKDVSVR